MSFAYSGEGKLVVRRVPQTDEDYVELVGTKDPAAIAEYREAGWELVDARPDNGHVRSDELVEDETVLGWRRDNPPQYPRDYEPLTLPG